MRVNYTLALGRNINAPIAKDGLKLTAQENRSDLEVFYWASKVWEPDDFRDVWRKE